MVIALPVRTLGQESLNAKYEYSGNRRITSEELLSVSRSNLWDAICGLDPALNDCVHAIQGDALEGTPNGATIRGISSWSLNGTEHLPLLILDGARTPITRLGSIDIHDVTQVIIYKDPVSLTAFGLQGINGVIEIQTRKNKSGALSLTYRFDATANWADLSSWNRQGIHNHWMDDALRTGFTNSHSLDAEGGDEHVGYKFSARLSPSGKGVMKGNNRDMLELRSFVEYKYRALNVSNDITFDQVKSTASPYGTFNYQSLLPSAWTATDERGELREVLEDGTTGDWWINPEYEASLKSSDKTKRHTLSDRFRLNVALPEGFNIDGTFSFVRETERQDIYVSPLSGRFHEQDITTTGKYDILRHNTLSYEGKLMLNWNKQCGLSAWNAGGGVRIFSGKYYNESYGGLGILSDRMASISFTQTYDTLHTATARRYYDRTLQGFLSASYNYAGRYGTSLVFNCNRSSLLSPGKPVACFWGASLYWNLHNEAFLKHSDISRLILRASLGTTGGVAFTDRDYRIHYSNDTHNEYIYNYYQIGASLQGMPNEDLRWQTTDNRMLSAELEYKRISLSVDYYNNLTRDLPVMEQIPLATGFESRIGNGGKVRNSGIDFLLRAILLKRGDWQWSTQVSGAYNKNTIEEVPDFFSAYYNRNARESVLPISSHSTPATTILEKDRPLSGIYVYEGTELQDGKARYIGSSADAFRGKVGLALRWREWHIGASVACGTGGYNTNLLSAIPAGDAYYDRNHYLDLSNLQCGYTFAPSVCEKMKMKHLEAVLSGEHLARWRSSHMAEGILYPLTRRLVFSLCITF